MPSLGRFALLFCMLLCIALHADDAPPAEEAANPAYGQDGVGKALDWTQSVQAEDGSWFGSPRLTGLAVMMYLQRGETPLSERYGTSVQEAMKWMGKHAEAAPTTPLAGAEARDWGVFTCALLEAYGITRIPYLGQVAEKALARVIASQQADGGFDLGGTPEAPGDFGAAGWCILALHTGWRSGVYGDAERPELLDTCRRALAWLKTTAYHDGRFGHTPAGAPDNATGLGLLCLGRLDGFKSPEAVAAAKTVATERLALYQDFLDFALYGDFLDGTRDWRTATGPLLEGWLHDSTVMFTLQGTQWREWNKVYERVLVKNQHADGYWEVATGTDRAPTDADRLLATALCCLQLEVGCGRQLPSFDTLNRHLQQAGDEVDTGLIIE